MATHACHVSVDFSLPKQTSLFSKPSRVPIAASRSSAVALLAQALMSAIHPAIVSALSSTTSQACRAALQSRLPIRAMRTRSSIQARSSHPFAIEALSLVVMALHVAPSLAAAP